MNKHLNFVAAAVATLFAGQVLAWNPKECAAYDNLHGAGSAHRIDSVCPDTTVQNRPQQPRTPVSYSYEMPVNPVANATNRTNVRTDVGVEVGTSANARQQQEQQQRQAQLTQVETRTGDQSQRTQVEARTGDQRMQNQLDTKTGDQSLSVDTSNRSVNNSKTFIGPNPVTAFLQQLPGLEPSKESESVLCEYRGSSVNAGRKIFFNGTFTEGAKDSGLSAWTWKHLYQKNSDGTFSLDDFGQPKKIPYSRIFVPFEEMKLKDGFQFDGDLMGRITNKGMWIEIGKQVKFSYLTSAAAFNGSWAAAIGKDDKSVSVASANGSSLTDRVVVGVTDLNKSCVLDQDSLNLVKEHLVPKQQASAKAVATTTATVAVELVKDVVRKGENLVHANNVIPASTPWGSCGRGDKTGKLIEVTEAEYKAGIRCKDKQQVDTIEYRLQGPGSAATPVKVFTYTEAGVSVGK